MNKFKSFWVKDKDVPEGLSTSSLVQILCSGPNANATTVQARQITLYGMLKSGVGKETIAPFVLNTIGYPERRKCHIIISMYILTSLLDLCIISESMTTDTKAIHQRTCKLTNS